MSGERALARWFLLLAAVAGPVAGLTWGLERALDQTEVAAPGSTVEVDELTGGAVVVVVDEVSEDPHPATARAMTPRAATSLAVTRPASSSK